MRTQYWRNAVKLSSPVSSSLSPHKPIITQHIYITPDTPPFSSLSRLQVKEVRTGQFFTSREIIKEKINAVWTDNNVRSGWRVKEQAKTAMFALLWPNINFQINHSFELETDLHQHHHPLAVVSRFINLLSQIYQTLSLQILILQNTWNLQKIKVTL